MKRRLAIVAIMLGVVAAPAAAHIDVLPTRVEAEQSTEFTVRVPTERELPTTQVRVDFPKEVTVYAFAPPPQGWTAKQRIAPDGQIVGVVYSGGRIPVNGYQDFTFLGTPFETGTTVWKTYQTYADGKTKPWSDTPEAADAISPESGPTEPGPAAAVEVVAKGTLATAPAAAGSGGGTTTQSSDAAIWLGLIAIGIASCGFFLAGFLWTRRPMRLPGDPPDTPSDR
ncbi:MAG: DUF1775 domain-containing protein [Actinobacteria bacterium]|nr:DUF1775 domain-containing protein [Thermoleophilia bacterium]MCB9010246.1 DUF1775 domain-containing protein [Actinomycetota bacterium]